MTIPKNILEDFEETADKYDFGRITLEVVIHDGLPRYRITTETSYIPGRETSGSKEDFKF